MSEKPRTLYNLGAGQQRLFPLLANPAVFDAWREIRVDVDPTCRPDIQASLTDLTGAIPDGTADLIYCSHVLEHFDDHEVPLVLAECLRILHPQGAVVIRVPDLAQIFTGNGSFDPEKVLYNSKAGPISVLDVIYGHRGSVEAGNVYMRHRTGFTEVSLARRLLAAGFDEVQTRTGPAAEFCAIATRDAVAHQTQIDALIAYMG